MTATEPPNSNDDKPQKAFRLTEGLMLAIASVAAYFLAYTYERGYASVFGIPPPLISISVANILLLGSIVFVGAMAVFPFLQLISFILPRGLHPIVRSTLRTLLFAGIIPIGLILIYGLPLWRHWILLAAFYAFLVLITFIFPLFRQGATYIDRLQRQAELEAGMPGLLDHIVESVGWNTFALIFGLLVGVAFSNALGQAEALRQTNFLVLDQSPELVVLRVYGDKLITSPLDRASKEIEPRFTVLHLDDNPALVLVPEDVGPLGVKSLPMGQPQPTATSTPVASSQPGTPTLVLPTTTAPP